LPQQSAFQPLDLLLEERVEFLVLVALTLKLRAALLGLAEARFECFQALFERRLSHGNYECKIL